MIRTSNSLHNARTVRICSPVGKSSHSCGMSRSHSSATLKLQSSTVDQPLANGTGTKRHPCKAATLGLQQGILARQHTPRKITTSCKGVLGNSAACAGKNGPPGPFHPTLSTPVPRNSSLLCKRQPKSIMLARFVMWLKVWMPTRSAAQCNCSAVLRVRAVE